jgi:hypothetical protein
MKKLISLLILLAWSLNFLPAQSIPNGSFESWMNNPAFNVEEPEFWITSNISAAAMGLPPNVTKTQDAHTGNYAIKLETVLDTDGEPFMGAAFMTAGISGSRPGKVRGYYKADLQGPDEVAIGIIMRTGEMIIGAGDIELTNSASEFTFFEFEIEYLLDLVPDTILMSIFNDNIDLGTEGTVLILDDLSFDVTSAAPDLGAAAGIRVSPNPVVDQLQVELAPEVGTAAFLIYDLNGRLLANHFVAGQATISINLPSGMYCYELRDRSGSVLAVDQFIIR